MFLKRLPAASVLPLFILAVSLTASANETGKHSIQLTAEQLNAVSGEYTDPAEPDGRLSFYGKDGKLYLESERIPPEALDAVSATEFFLPKYHLTQDYPLDQSSDGGVQ